MRLFELVKLSEDGGTVSGAIATVAVPLGGTISRNGDSFFSGVTTVDATPNTPKKYKKKSKFQNSL